MAVDKDIDADVDVDADILSASPVISHTTKTPMVLVQKVVQDSYIQRYGSFEPKREASHAASCQSEVEECPYGGQAIRGRIAPHEICVLRVFGACRMP